MAPTALLPSKCRFVLFAVCFVVFIMFQVRLLSSIYGVQQMHQSIGNANTNNNKNNHNHNPHGYESSSSSSSSSTSSDLAAAAGAGASSSSSLNSRRISNASSDPTTTAGSMLRATATTSDQSRMVEVPVEPQNEGRSTDPSATTNKMMVPTIDCREFVPKAQQGQFGFQDPNANFNRTALQRYTEPQLPQFWISLHHQKYDPTRYSIMTVGQYYEHSLEEIWRTILKESPKHSIVLDVGANIGYFTLVSLAMADGDFIVEAFEPNPINLLRLCESLQLNNWYNRPVQLHPVGISEFNHELPFWISSNPGMSQFYSSTDHPDLQGKRYTMEQVISLDSLAEQKGWFASTNEKTVIAILKIDVEGQEHHALAGAKRLLQSHMIQNIFMEVSVRTPDEVTTSRKSLQLILDAHYKLVGQGGFAGPDRDVTWEHDDQFIDNTIHAATQTHAKQLNTWFQPIVRVPEQDTGVVAAASK